MTRSERKNYVKTAAKLMRDASTLLIALGPKDPLFSEGLKIDDDARHLDRLSMSPNT